MPSITTPEWERKLEAGIKPTQLEADSSVSQPAPAPLPLSLFPGALEAPGLVRGLCFLLTKSDLDGEEGGAPMDGGLALWLLAMPPTGSVTGASVPWSVTCH